MERHPITNPDGQITVTSATEYCSGEGGFVRDIFIVIDGKREVNWMIPSYERAKWISSPLPGNPCRECGRMSCSSIKARPSGNGVKISKEKEKEILAQYHEYLLGRNVDADISRAQYHYQRKYRVQRASQRISALYASGDDHPEALEGIPELDAPLVFQSVAKAAWEKTRQAEGELKSRLDALGMVVRVILGKWRGKQREASWPVSGWIDEMLKDLEQLEHPVHRDSVVETETQDE